MIISKFISICLSLAERKINFDYDRYSDLYTRCLHTFYMYEDVRCRKWWRIKTANRLEIHFNCWWKTVQSSTVSVLRQSQALPICSWGFWIDEWLHSYSATLNWFLRVCVCVCASKLYQSLLYVTRENYRRYWKQRKWELIGRCVRTQSRIRLVLNVFIRSTFTDIDWSSGNRFICCWAGAKAQVHV